MDYDEVLVPTDGSTGTRTIVERAIDVAATREARVHALYVVDTGGLAASIADEPLTVVRTREGERATEEVVERAVAASIPATAVVREGVPHNVILDYVVEADIDLVVMGTHGRSGLDRVVLGSVTERVVRRAPVPVMTVHLSDDEQVVTDADRAVEVARRAIDREGYEVDEIEDVHRTRGTWIVQAQRDDVSLNVHVDAVTEAVRIAELTNE